MKVTIYRPDGPPIEMTTNRMRVRCDSGEHFEMRESSEGGMLVRIEELNDSLTLDLAMFPNGGNGVRLKGGLR